MKMPRLFLTIFVTAGLFFLPSCSSGSGQADCESIQQEVTAQGKKMNALIAEGVDVVSTDRQKAKELMMEMRIIEFMRAQNIVAAPGCFPATEVSEAEDLVSIK